MKRYQIKEIELSIHEGNYNRRVRYNNKDFDLLVIRVEIGANKKRYIAVSSDYLTEHDSIHLNYNPFSEEIKLVPFHVNEHAVDVTDVVMSLL